MTAESLEHIRRLHSVLSTLRKAVEAADLRVSLGAGASINNALVMASVVEEEHSVWLLGSRQ